MRLPASGIGDVDEVERGLKWKELDGKGRVKKDANESDCCRMTLTQIAERNQWKTRQDMKGRVRHQKWQ